MITSRQVRAARALLGWTQEMLADKALVALTALKRLESNPLNVRGETRHRIHRTLRAAGISFVSRDDEEGVIRRRNRLSRAGSPESPRRKAIHRNHPAEPDGRND